MPSSLRSKLDELASSFANDVLQAIRSASIEDLLGGPAGGGRRVAASARAARATVGVGGKRRRGGRLARRSAGDIAGVVDQIIGLLRQSPKGLRAEQIRQKLGLQSKELPRPLKEGVDSGRLGKSGQKRATTYFVKGASTGPKGGGASRAPAAKKAARAKRKK